MQYIFPRSAQHGFTHAHKDVISIQSYLCFSHPPPPYDKAPPILFLTTQSAAMAIRTFALRPRTVNAYSQQLRKETTKKANRNNTHTPTTLLYNIRPRSQHGQRCSVHKHSDFHPPNHASLLPPPRPFLSCLLAGFSAFIYPLFLTFHSHALPSFFSLRVSSLFVPSLLVLF